MALSAWPTPRARKPWLRLEFSAAAVFCPASLIDVKDPCFWFSILPVESKGGRYADRFDAGFRGGGGDVRDLCRRVGLGRAPVPVAAAGAGRQRSEAPQLLIALALRPSQAWTPATRPLRRRPFGEV